MANMNNITNGFISKMIQKIKGELATKVDKVEGKDLSTNDLTDALKANYDDAVTKAHEHANKEQLDKLTEDVDGNLLYDGVKLKSTNDLSNEQVEAIAKIETIEAQVTTNKNDITTINTTLLDKVDKEENKGLSTNDFTNELKTKLENIDDSLIDDTEAKVNKTYSSNKITEAIAQCLKDSKAYTLEEIAKKIGTSYKVVADTDSVTEAEYLYLVGNDTNGYKIYALIEDKAIKISDGIISLEGYVQKETGKSLVLDTEIAKIHSHTNAAQLDKISEDEEGNLLYNNIKIKSSNDLTDELKAKYDAVADKLLAYDSINDLTGDDFDTLWNAE